MKHLPSTLVLICAALTATLPLIAESLRDAVADAERLIIQKYETPLARQMAMDDLTKILKSNMTDEEKIVAIHAEFSSAPALPIPIPDKPAQSDNLADLIFRPPLQWQIQSIEIAYDIDSVTNLLFSTESIYQEGNSQNREDSIGESDVTRKNVGAKTVLDVDVGGDINVKGWNPLNWFQAKAGFQWVTSGNAGIDYTKTKSSQWNERAQRALSSNYEEKARILQDTRITKCHLTFYILFKNNTDKDLLLDPREFSVPVYAGENRPLTDAFPDTRVRSFRISPNASANLKFRAELNTTSALDLINYMRTNEPMIRLDRAQSTIASSDGSIQNAVQDSIQVKTVPVRCRDMALKIRKYNKKDNPVTVADAMRALNAVFTKEPFMFDKNGNCVALMDIPLEKKGEVKVSLEKLPVLEINGNLSSAQIPSGTMKRPLSDDGIVFDIVNIVSDDEIEEVWDNTSPSFQEHYVSYLKPVAEQGDGQAQNILACCYYSARGVKLDYAEAFRWFLKSAEKGVLDSIYMIGVCYEEGYGVTQNSVEAAKWYRKAADQGHPRSQSSLGRLYMDGKGVMENKTEGVKWFRKSAEQGYDFAQCMLGFCYSQGDGISQDYSEAVRWFKKAAGQGYLFAQSALGDCYYNGNGVTQDYAEAVKWYRKAADQGVEKAQNMLGICYSNGRGVREDQAEAVKWFRKSADQGYDRAQFNLGDCYYAGDGVRQDYTEAANWFRKAADQGNADAQEMLGLCYHAGRGVLQNYTEAVKWWRKAADQGDVYAQYWLGFCYMEGNGITKDSFEAVKWYRVAAEQGYDAAQHNLGDCYLLGNGVSKDYSEAAKWYYKSASQGNDDAQFWLGALYETGKGVSKDINEAVKWFRKAAEQGHEDAKTKLKQLGY